MTVAISEEMIARYRASARQREGDRQTSLDTRFVAAWNVARHAAAMLRERYGVDNVWAFGSLLDRAKFFERSDIDLAVHQIDGREYYRAVSALLDLSPDFSFDLVEVDFAPASLQQTILSEGIPL